MYAEVHSESVSSKCPTTSVGIKKKVAYSVSLHPPFCVWNCSNLFGMCLCGLSGGMPKELVLLGKSPHDTDDVKNEVT